MYTDGSLNEETCEVSGSFPFVESKAGGFRAAINLGLSTDEQGGFLLPGKDFTVTKPRTFFAIFAQQPDHCFMIRDKSGKPKAIQLGEETGVNLGEVFVPSTAVELLQTATFTPATGAVQGVLIGGDSNRPIADAYILLCEVVDPAATEPECLLDATMATVTDTDGRFEFASVPEGTYVVVYGLSDEAKGSHQTWDGRSVLVGSPLMDAPDPFGGNQGVTWRKGSEIGITEGKLGFTAGSLVSNEFGLSIEYHQFEPLTVSVTAGQAAQITVEVTGH